MTANFPICREDHQHSPATCFQADSLDGRHWRVRMSAILLSVFVGVCFLLFFRHQQKEAEIAAHREQQQECVRFTEGILRKPVRSYAASDLERINACNAYVGYSYSKDDVSASVSAGF